MTFSYNQDLQIPETGEKNIVKWDLYIYTLIYEVRQIPQSGSCFHSQSVNSRSAINIHFSGVGVAMTHVFNCTQGHQKVYILSMYVNMPFNHVFFRKDFLKI